MKIYLIRHGCTAGNLEHRYVGTTDEPLTEEARQWLMKYRDLYPQIVSSAQECSDEKDVGHSGEAASPSLVSALVHDDLESTLDMDGAPFCVFASPLKRCTETAGLLFPGADIQILPDLRECGFGEFEYKNYEDLKHDARYQAWIDSGGTTAFPGGESRDAFIERCCRAFLEGCARAKEEGASSVAFVVHGGTIMAILDRFSEPHRDYFDWQVKNAEGFACEWEMAGRAGTLRSIRPIPATPGLTGIENEFVMKQNKKLRCGYTTGSCAAAAAAAASEMLLTGRVSYRVDLMTPKGIRLHLPVEEPEIAEEYASCAVRKYAGDDPDVTDGLFVYARAERISVADNIEGNTANFTDEGKKVPSDGRRDRTTDENTLREGGACEIETCSNTAKDFSGKNALADVPRIVIDGGVGVGRVTKPGLWQSIGEAAINRVPREMITQAVEAVCERWEYTGGIKITISVPEGVEVAKRTFNPHLGIEGGISILGTSGIVIPMSEDALIESIRVEMRQKIAQGEKYLLITPGNYGEDFVRQGSLETENHPEEIDWKRWEAVAQSSMKCSNYVGETLDIAQELGAKGILFVSHIGKFIKVSGGIMNTHSAHADCRAELIAAQAMRAGTPPDTVRKLLDTNTTEEAVGILLEAGWLEPTMREVTGRIRFHLQKHCKNALETEVILFSSEYGYLGESDGARKMMKKMLEDSQTE